MTRRSRLAACLVALVAVGWLVVGGEPRSTAFASDPILDAKAKQAQLQGQDTVSLATHVPYADVKFIGVPGINKIEDLKGKTIAVTRAGTVTDVVARAVLPKYGLVVDKDVKISYLDTLRAYATFKDPKELLFFTRTEHGKSEAKAFIKRLNERTNDRDKATTIRAIRTQPVKGCVGLPAASESSD